MNIIEPSTFRISAPHFVAGGMFSPKMDSRYKIVVEAAPIIKYMLGWQSYKVEEYCRKKKWEIEIN